MSVLIISLSVTVNACVLSHCVHNGASTATGRPMQTKKCSKCGEVKALDDFYKQRRTSDNRQSICKPCSREALRQWYSANPTQAKAWARAYRAANRKNYKAYSAAWYADNSEKARAWARAQRAANPEHVRALKNAWNAANPEKVKTMNSHKVEAATSSYIAAVVRLPVTLLPQDFIEAKRAHLKLVRKLKELK